MKPGLSWMKMATSPKLMKLMAKAVAITHRAAGMGRADVGLGIKERLDSEN